MSEQPDRLISLASAARRWGVCPRTIRRWVDDGRLPAVQAPSGRFRVSAAVLDQLLAPANKVGHLRTNGDVLTLSRSQA